MKTFTVENTHLKQVLLYTYNKVCFYAEIRNIICGYPFLSGGFNVSLTNYGIQSTLVISNSKGLSELLRDIRTSTYQICRIEEKIIRTTTFNKYICNWTFEVGDMLKILWKRGEIAPEEQFLLFSTICFYLLLVFMLRQGPDFHFKKRGYSR